MIDKEQVLTYKGKVVRQVSRPLIFKHEGITLLRVTNAKGADLNLAIRKNGKVVLRDVRKDPDAILLLPHRRNETVEAVVTRGGGKAQSEIPFEFALHQWRKDYFHVQTRLLSRRFARYFKYKKPHKVLFEQRGIKTAVAVGKGKTLYAWRKTLEISGAGHILAMARMRGAGEFVLALSAGAKVLNKKSGKAGDIVRAQTKLKAGRKSISFTAISGIKDAQFDIMGFYWQAGSK